MVFRSDDENEFIEQYSNDKKVYAVFKSQRKPGAIPWNCSTTEKTMVTSLNNQATALSLTTARSGGNLKTLRLAQSCNAEYSNYFKATSAADVGKVLAAFNATLTRCNGVYEKDLAIHLNLISNSTSVIYYNASTDPYTTMGSWNSQLQSTLTSVIAEANYDIGHMFGASGGGGNAGCIGCICVDGSKGSGITSPADAIPEGDNFDIDYVVHEIGHQLGANHTFSMSTEGTGVNKEVGSGITIMGYAGITSQDVAPHSIDIFHQASIAQIQTNVNNKSTCGITISNSSIATPVVIVPKSAYTIPKSTPFALTASATDANANDVLTYCWEQNDKAGSTQTGASSVASATKATGPNWISFTPSISSTRLFPKLSTILSGATVSGPLTGGDAGANTEALSSVARTLNFRLTVRDNAPYKNSADTGYSIGQTSFADVIVTVNGTAGPFAVTAPNTAISWSAGSTQTITWSVNSTNLSPVNCSKVKITLSTDGGNTFPIVLSDSTANDGTEALVIPNSVSNTARIKIEAVGNIFFDISNTNFTISQPALCGDVTGLNTSSITDNSARISWRKVNSVLSYALQYKLNSDTGWTTFNNTQTQTDTTAVLTGLISNTSYNWRVRSTCTEGAGDFFQANFTTLPNCGTPTGLSTNVITGSSANISWPAVTSAINYKVEYKLNSATVWIVLNDTSTSRSLNLTNLQNSTTYNWRVSARCVAGLGSTTSANFTTLCQSRYDSAANGVITGAALIPFNTNINGLINIGRDIDNYKIVFSRAGTITITLSNLVANYNLKLLNGSGTQLAISQKSNRSNEIINYSVASGTYYVQVYGASSNIFDATSCYILKVALGTAAKTLDEITSSSNKQSTATIELNPNKSVIVYPNPVKDKLNIKLTGIEGISEFIIYNSNGEKMMSAKTNNANTDLDLRSLKPGYYIIKVINQNKIESSLKIIKL